MEEAAREGDEFAASRNVSDEEVEAQVIEDSLCPPDDPVETALANLVGLDTVKHQIRGLRRTLEMQAAGKSNAATGSSSSSKQESRVIIRVKLQLWCCCSPIGHRPSGCRVKRGPAWKNVRREFPR